MENEDTWAPEMPACCNSLGVAKLMPAFTAWVCFALAGVTRAEEVAPSLPPTLEDFCSNEAILSPQLSPDGTRIAFATPIDGIFSLALFHLDTGKVDLLVREGKGDITTVFWKSDSRLIYGGYHGETLACLFLDGKHRPEVLTGPRNGYSELVDTLPADPQHIIVARDNICRIDVETAGVEYISPENGIHLSVGDYVMDREGVARLRLYFLSDHIELQHRRRDKDEFQTLLSWKTPEPGADILGFAGDDDIVYCRTHDDGNFGVLHALDLRTGILGPALASVPGAEIRNALFSRDGSRLLGISVEKDVLTAHWLDEGMKRLQDRIDASLPGRNNDIVSSSTDGLVHLILSATSQDIGTYYILDMRRHALLPFGRVNPRLDPAKMGPVTCHDITAGDGFVFHAVLTIPNGGENAAHPMVVFPEGQFFSARFTADFNLLTQFLASRGYAVLRVDYRGAWGYGKSYRDAGKHEITGRIPGDIHDAVEWAIKSGYAQRDRVCIWGEGFGGSLALMAVTHEPDMYRCAINEDGEGDLTLLASRRWEFLPWYNRQMEELVGADVEQLKSRSPMLALENLKVPLLNIYANADRNPVWGRLEWALKRAHRDYVVFKPFQPGLKNAWLDYKIDWHQQVDAFLSANLMGPRPGALPSSP